VEYKRRKEKDFTVISAEQAIEMAKREVEEGCAVK